MRQAGSRKAGTSAPGHALYLVNVTYPDRLFEV